MIPKKSFFSRALVAGIIAASLVGCTCKRKAEPTEGTIPVAMEGGMFKDVRFGFDSYSLTPEAKTILDDNAAVLAKDEAMKVTVEGHCDERGTNEYNMALGARRAEAAKDYLVKVGIPESRLMTISYGEEVPLDAGSTEAAWAKNRRVHLTAAQ